MGYLCTRSEVLRKDLKEKLSTFVQTQDVECLLLPVDTLSCKFRFRTSGLTQGSHSTSNASVKARDNTFPVLVLIRNILYWYKPHTSRSVMLASNLAMLADSTFTYVISFIGDLRTR